MHVNKLDSILAHQVGFQRIVNFFFDLFSPGFDNVTSGCSSFQFVRLIDQLVIRRANQVDQIVTSHHVSNARVNIIVEDLLATTFRSHRGVELFQIRDSPPRPAVNENSFLVTRLHVFGRSVPRQQSFFQFLHRLDQRNAELQTRFSHERDWFAELCDDCLFAFLNDVCHQVSNDQHWDQNEQGCG